MRLRHLVPVTALLAVLLSCSGDSTGGRPDPGPQPAQLQAVAGAGQTALTETTLPVALVVKVVDRSGTGVGGVTVAWTLDAGGGTLSAATTPTDAAGEARVQWTLGADPGTFTARAEVARLTAAQFAATAELPRAAVVEKVGGDGQAGAPAGGLRDSLAVKVTSAEGRLVRGATVTWSVAEGGGTVAAATATTNTAGIAKAHWTLGAAGANAVTVTVGTVAPVTFTATAIPVASVSLTPATPRVGRGDVLALSAVPRDAAGNALPDRPVRWSTSAAGIAEVSASGVVTGTGYGTATITAASEEASASVTVTVTTEDRTGPALTGLSFTPASVDVTSAAAPMEFTLSATDAGSGVDWVGVLLGGGGAGACSTPPSGNEGLVSGTPANGTWKCTFTVPRGAVGGTWVVSQANLIDRAGNQSIFSRPALQAAGFPTEFRVVNDGPAVALPAVTAVSITPDPVNVSASAATADIVVSARAGAGVEEVRVGAVAVRGEPAGSQTARCSVTAPSSGTAAEGTWRCTVTLPRDAAAGTWRVYLGVSDHAASSAEYSPEELAAAGFSSTFQVVSANEDVTPPTLTSLLVSPATVNVADGEKYVQFTLTASDAGTGVWLGTPALSRPDGKGGQGCTASSQSGGTPQAATIRCSIPVAAGALEGAWGVSVSLTDAVGNYRQYSSADLKAMGFPAEVTVTR